MSLYAAHRYRVFDFHNLVPRLNPSYAMISHISVSKVNFVKPRKKHLIYQEVNQQFSLCTIWALKKKEKEHLSDPLRCLSEMLIEKKWGEMAAESHSLSISLLSRLALHQKR